MLINENLDFWPSKGLWSREQTILALFWYYQLPFGKLHARNPLIIKWAELIKRNSNALAMKLVNLASLDPIIIASGRRGMGNTSALDKEVWEYYSNRLEQLTLDAETLLNNLRKASESLIYDQYSQLEELNTNNDYYGEEREVITRQRIRQNFFRSTILSNFEERCCICGLAEPRLLVASHIVGWADAPDKRLSPHNGLSLSPLYDRAFDQHLLTLNTKLEVMISPKLHKVAKTTFYNIGLSEIEGKSIIPPIRFGIDMDLLAQHRQQFLNL
ncbi:HNH endonuclease [Acinetobacter baumannii]|uniref:HNH endonuclease n=1 Tax=Acinetobacter baumannii TaxID=470 RepID=UPI001865AC5B|nr:HNH endonuclease [Acinetobacter baumannii]MCY2773661.1 HNH endonuclease [Acinetobacter baumannii]MCY2775374.1 HNH endonuclease [Acinetobacter baumannii]MCY2798311.1 HNH endonuclease [Acinetobacter baumannii]MCY2805768.1 HNH endonuclease [Acinetobacter baumannii]MCY2885631.1 HNH endonuclease [Acinetobacter baumannii]